MATFHSRILTLSAASLILAVTHGCGDSGSSKKTTAQAGTGNQATTPQTNPTRTRAGGSMMLMPDPIVDFGDIQDYETRKASVSFTNNGDQTLEVFRVQPTCGCTTTALEKTLFAPGEGDVIELTFKPKGSGKQTKVVRVLTNDVANPSQEIKIKANVISSVTVTPPALSFGRIALNQGATRSLTIKAPNESFELGDVKIFGDLRAKSSLTLKRLSAEGVVPKLWRVDVAIDPSIDWGWYTGSVRVNGTVQDPADASPRPVTKTVGMNANVQGKVQASDSMFRLLSLPQGRDFQKNIRLSRADGQPLEILSAKVVGGNLANMNVIIKPLQNSAGGVYELTLVGNTGDITGVIKGNVQVTTNVPGEEEIILKIAGSVRAK
ncbi:MAG: hypothetical protein CMJ33_10470 [Phycisphaerae bacterium]|nr:hypothetical protein [Phycisphaerae bacterium]